MDVNDFLDLEKRTICKLKGNIIVSNSKRINLYDLTKIMDNTFGNYNRTIYKLTWRIKNELNSFLKFINPNISFTTVIEQNMSLNFLDLTIKIGNNKHEFNIYHKPTHTDTTIHNKSTHPYQHKIAAYNSMIDRLINLPLSEENFTTELNLIKQIAVNNDYKPELIDNIYLLKNRSLQFLIILVNLVIIFPSFSKSTIIIPLPSKLTTI